MSTPSPDLTLSVSRSCSSSAFSLLLQPGRVSLASCSTRSARARTAWLRWALVGAGASCSDASSAACSARSRWMCSRRAPSSIPSGAGMLWEWGRGGYRALGQLSPGIVPTLLSFPGTSGVRRPHSAPGPAALLRPGAAAPALLWGWIRARAPGSARLRLLGVGRWHLGRCPPAVRAHGGWTGDQGVPSTLPAS